MTDLHVDAFLGRPRDPQSLIDLLLRFGSLTCILLTSYVLTIAIYRLWFHPLSKYPGPLLGKLTNGYAFYYGWKSTSHIQIDKLHKKYGPIVRYRPDALSFNEIEAIKEIYGYKTNVQKSKVYRIFPPTVDTGSTHSMIDRQQHARKRRVLAHCFSDATLKALGGHIMDCVNTLNKVLGSGGKDWGEVRDMSVLCNSLTFDVMGAVTFSKSYGMIESQDNVWLQDAIVGSGKHKFIFGHMQQVYNLGLDRIIFPTLASARSKIAAYSAEQMRERIESDGEKHDFVRFMLEARDPQTGKGFTFPELASESSLLIGAGADTTSTALAAAWYYMTHHPEKLARLVAEIRSTFSSLDQVAVGSRMSSCQYLRAFIDESMRLSPPVPGMLYREVLPGGLKVAGQIIPEGMDVAVPTYAVMRNPTYYPEPERFLPERWLETKDDPQSKRRLKIAQAAFCPFSIGPRSCIGRSLAYQELTLSIARALWQYDVRLQPGSKRGDAPDGNFTVEDWFIAKKTGPLCQFKMRDDLVV